MSEKQQPTRRERARREAVVGALCGAIKGLALGLWLGGTLASGIGWALLLAGPCALLFHHNEYMCG